MSPKGLFSGLAVYGSGYWRSSLLYCYTVLESVCCRRTIYMLCYSVLCLSFFNIYIISTATTLEHACDVCLPVSAIKETVLTTNITGMPRLQPRVRVTKLSFLRSHILFPTRDRKNVSNDISPPNQGGTKDAPNCKGATKHKLRKQSLCLWFTHCLAFVCWLKGLAPLL